MDFITENPVTRRKEQLAEQERAARIAQQRDMTFRNDQEDRKMALDADQATRDYIGASFRPEPRTPIPAIGPIANPAPDQTARQPITAATPGFNPDAPGPQNPPQAVQISTEPRAAKPTAVNVPVNNSYGDRDVALEKLLQTPGTGKFAQEEIQRRRNAQVAEQERQQKQQDDAERYAFEALAAGKADEAEFHLKRAGIQLPPSVLQDARMRQNLGRGGLLAESFYPGDDAAAGKFTIAYMQSGGDMAQALQIAGPPKGKENWTTIDLIQEGQTVLARFNADTGEIDIPSYNGQPVVTKAPGSKTGQQFLFETKVQAYKVAFAGDPNVDRNAVLFANGDLKMDQTDARDLAWEMAKEMVKANGGFLPGTNREATQQDYKDLADQFYRDIQSTGGQASSVPVPTVQQPTPTGQYQEAPRDPAQRTVGQTYNTPQGPLIWQGQGWQRPQTSN